MEIRDSEKPAIVTAFDAGYARSGLVANWLASVRRVGLADQVVLFPMDLEAAQYARATGVETVELWPEVIPTTDSITPYAAADFKAVSLRKMDAIRHVLAQGRTVLFSDADIVFLRDPFPMLAEFAEEIVAQSDVPPNRRLSAPRGILPRWFQRRRCRNTLCAGFLRVRATSATLRVFDTAREDVGRFCNDQTLLHDRLVWRAEASWALLPQDEFPNGAYLAMARWRRGNQAMLNDAVIVHVNWCLSERKIELLKELGLWHAGGGVRNFRTPPVTESPEVYESS